VAGTYCDHLVQLPDCFGADQKLEQGVKGIVQQPRKHCQAWGIDHLSRKPVPGLGHPLGGRIQKQHLHSFLAAVLQALRASSREAVAFQCRMDTWSASSVRAAAWAATSSLFSKCLQNSLKNSSATLIRIPGGLSICPQTAVPRTAWHWPTSVVSWSCFSIWDDLALAAMRPPKWKLSECQLWLFSSRGGRHPLEKRPDWHHQLHGVSPPTELVRGSAGCGGLDLVVMTAWRWTPAAYWWPKPPWRHLSGSTLRACCAAVRCRERWSSCSGLLYFDCRKLPFKIPKLPAFSRRYIHCPQYHILVFLASMNQKILYLMVCLCGCHTAY